MLKFPWNHFHIPYILSVFFSHKHKINFCSTSTSTISDFPLACLIKPSVCYAQFSFITKFQQSPSFCISFPNTIPLVYTFKTLSTSHYMSIEISQRNNDFTRTSQVPLTHYFIAETNFLCVWFSALWTMSTYYAYHFPT